MARRYVCGRFLGFCTMVQNPDSAPITFGRFLAFATTVANPDFVPIRANLTEGRFTASASSPSNSR
jgi:hypothetical protein